MLDKENVRQNLNDCGCEIETIDGFFRLYEAGRVKDAVALLRRHRCDLMDALHVCQSKVDCLDYLVHQIGKGE